jgi:hypothetical protein
VATALLLPGRLTAAKSEDPAEKGDVLYTKFALFFEKGCHITTNYRRGVLLPVNTAVTLVKVGRNAITVTLSDGRQLKIDNVRDFSGEDIDGIFSRTFSKTKTDLTQFTDEERAAIIEGKARPGMRRSAVIVALGYPPKHKTPSLENNQWRYWSSRFGSFLIHFQDDKVSRIEN